MNLKFRVWYGGQLHDHKEACRILYNNACEIESLKHNVIFLQYVGSKLGETELFEGDIVNVQGTKSKGIYKTEIIRKGQGFTLKVNNTYYKDDWCFIAIKEVLGNVYQNPEILK